VLPHDELEPTTRQVLEAVPARGGAGLAQIAVRAGVDAATAHGLLGVLAAGGFVERCGQGWRIPRRPRPTNG
jgi:DNA processing protein